MQPRTKGAVTSAKKKHKSEAKESGKDGAADKGSERKKKLEEGDFKVRSEHFPRRFCNCLFCFFFLASWT